MRNLLIIIFCSLILTSCDDKPERTLMFVFENNYFGDVDFLYPKRYMQEVPFSWGTMHDLDPNDTTSTGAWQAHFAYIHLLPYSKCTDNSGFFSIADMSPYDTVRLFVFDGHHHYLPYYEENINNIYESEDYYCRYDLTSNDLKFLADSNGDIVVSFPPSEKMKNVKMHPKYEDVLQMCK